MSDTGKLHDMKQRASRAWKTSRSLGFRIQLDQLPAEPPMTTDIDLSFAPVDNPRAYDGFARERTRATGDDVAEAADRDAMAKAGVEQLYVATTPDGSPAYAQWLVTPDNEAGLQAFYPGLFPKLAPGEALIEGAYAFVEFRNHGVVYPCAHQLLEIARDRGFATVDTFCSSEFRGIVRILTRLGMELHQVRVDRRRLWKRTSTFQAPTPEDFAGVEAMLQKR